MNSKVRQQYSKQISNGFEESPIVRIKAQQLKLANFFTHLYEVHPAKKAVKGLTRSAETINRDKKNNKFGPILTDMAHIV